MFWLMSVQASMKYANVTRDFAMFVSQLVAEMIQTHKYGCGNS